MSNITHEAPITTPESRKGVAQMDEKKRSRVSIENRRISVLQLLKEGIESQAEIGRRLGLTQGFIGHVMNHLIESGDVVQQRYNITPKGMMLLELVKVREEIEGQLRTVQETYPRDGFTLGHERGLLQTAEILTAHLSPHELSDLDEVVDHEPKETQTDTKAH